MFCCLGVLCEIAVADGVIAPAEYVREEDVYRYGTRRNTLPEEVRLWAGMHTEFGNLTGGYAGVDHDNSLAGRNDNGDSFAEIADIIEEYVDIL
jgi:hypothetical protein